MHKSLFIIFTVTFFINVSGNFAFADDDARECQAPWLGSNPSQRCDWIDVDSLIDDSLHFFEAPSVLENIFGISTKIRTGYVEESSTAPFRGNIVYFEGLGDSFQNHMPLFSKLSPQGFRVIGFDYLGQGGSDGNMDQTRIWNISEMGLNVYKIFGRDQNRFPKPIILGWSTGGLAAYLSAYKEQARAVVLIAPGIVPNISVGENNVLKLQFDKITLNTLTTAKYQTGDYNPHVDPIFPESPLLVPHFAANLQFVAAVSRLWKMNSHVPGFVLLSGDGDNYVNAAKTRAVLKVRAPTFSIKQYPGTLHEIDNEATPQRDKAHKDILNFLMGLGGL